MIKKIVKFCVTAFAALIYLCPFYILIVYALKRLTDQSSKWIPPAYLYLDNFINVLKKGNLLTAIKNNIIITASAVIIIILISSFASYPLARLKTKLNNTIYMVLIAFMIVPPLSILVPLYRFMIDINGMNTYWGIILLHVTFNVPLAVFLYTGFMNNISVQLDEAAIIDGCNRISLFFRIIFPLLKNITVTVAILSGVSIWNDYQFSNFFLESSSMFTPTKALSQFISQFGNELGLVAAGCIISMLPILILYFLLQKQFMSGSVAGAIKG